MATTTLLSIAMTLVATSAAFAGRHAPIVRHRTTAATLYLPSEPASEPYTMTEYVRSLEAKVGALAQSAGRPMPARCVGDTCLDLSSYIVALENAANNLRPLSGRVVPTATPQGTLTGYLARLESKVQSLSSKLGVASPQQCDDNGCMPLESYVELLEGTAATLEMQWQSLDGTTDWGSEAPSAGSDSLGEYVRKLEEKVDRLSERLGSTAPSRCIGEACIDLQSYVDLLEETALTLERQWETHCSSTW